MLSFTVARRTREIGVRVALGGSRERVIGAILRRPLLRVGLGVLLGSAMVLRARGPQASSELGPPDPAALGFLYELGEIAAAGGDIRQRLFG